jgi:hypothetical protein
MSESRVDSVWVFSGDGGRYPSGIFTSKERAAEWIARYRLSGMLTAYPIDEGVFSWAVRTGVFTAKSEKHSSSEFIQTFTTAAQDHFHYEQGNET